MATTIQLEIKTKKALDNLKIHRNETYNELIERLISKYPKDDKADLAETIEIISDPQTMRSIARGLDDFQAGRTKSLTKIKQEMGL